MLKYLNPKNYQRKIEEIFYKSKFSESTELEKLKNQFRGIGLDYDEGLAKLKKQYEKSLNYWAFSTIVFFRRTNQKY